MYSRGWTPNGTVPPSRRSRSRWARPAPLASDTERMAKMSIVDSRPEVGELQAELDQCNRSFESAPAGKIVAWSVERFGSKLAVASSFQDAVLIDIAMQVDPAIEVVFLDTGSH